MHDIYIIGGGSSLKGFEFGKLKGKRTCGVNVSAFLHGTNDIFSLDHNFIHNYHKDINKSNFDNVILCPVKERIDLYSKLYTVPVQWYYRKRNIDWEDDKVIWGHNSGIAAIVYYVKQGVKSIGLLGFDMKQGHYHKCYASETHNQQYQSWLPQFNELVGRAEIVNYSPDSAIECFPKRSLDAL